VPSQTVQPDVTAAEITRQLGSRRAPFEVLSDTPTEVICGTPRGKCRNIFIVCSLLCITIQHHYQPSTQQIRNKQTNITALILVYYVYLLQCFDPTGSSSGNFHEVYYSIMNTISNFNPY
jgi:hypothetical protein